MKSRPNSSADAPFLQAAIHFSQRIAANSPTPKNKTGRILHSGLNGTIRRAVALYDYVIQRRAEGHSLVLRDKAGREREIELL